MLGEAILANPTILERSPYPHPQDIALEYLSLCSAYPVASTYTIRHHLKSFFSSRLECQRTPYFKTFLAQLEVCERLEDFESLLQSPELLAAWPKTTDTTK
ncbi:hypothetical protein M407DRAFT_97523 [Tulasnella calospora MUT 4182]|uniref:Uncharacterized protein n=1 Tax=Tulasnella calospora MUT 4182 TaxID=1051891 RepID=A0A0C3QFL2_9AGAM|nr:hypothetical protein M407DRAFT_97523 [Tulasnella calospora MUT 4182]